MTSLRRRVAVWLVPPLLLLLGVNAAFTYRSSIDGANLAYDRSLRAAIKAIAERSVVRNGAVVVDIPYSALEIFDDDAQERVFYAVLDGQGRLLTGYPDLPLPPRTAADGALATSDAIYQGENVRTGAIRKRFYSSLPDGSDSILVVVAETLETRTELAHRLFFDNLRRQLLLILVGSVLVLLALGTAFKPLLHLRDTLRRRAEEDLTPVESSAVPSEIAPLIGAINQHMSRISAMLDARKRFLADAAHQLRTPLTVLGTQADYALRQDDPHEIRRSLEGMHRSIGSAQRLTNQMLALSRAEAINGMMRERSAVDLASLVREVALDLGPLALRKQLELAYEGPSDGVYVHGNAAMLRELISNLLDNAIQYTPEGGQVGLALQRVVSTEVSEEASALELSITDSGPGIPLQERENVFRRFYRLLDHKASHGSGLGLAIVREICIAHEGTVTLESGIGDVGLRVRVNLPELRRD